MAAPWLGIVVPAAGAILSVHLAAEEPRQQQPPIRSGVQAIEVDVRVFDKEGLFVTGLTRDAFEVWEDGVPHTVDALFLVGAPSASTAHAGVVTEPAASAPNPPSPAAARQIWIFVFDTNHLIPGGGFDRAKQAVTEFLLTRFGDGDVGGIVVNGKMVNNRLTSVREELVAAAGTLKPNSDLRSRNLELTREWPRLQDELEAIRISNGDKDALQGAVIRACTDDSSACRNVPPDMAVEQKARRFHSEFERNTLNTLTTMATLASGLTKLAGPKTVVLLSDGFVTERMETTLQQVVGQTTRAGARIYAIDVRGLNRGRGAGIIDQPAVANEAGAFAQFDVLADGPNSLAVDTGGLLIRNENDIGRALTTIAEDAGTYYVIGYRPSNQTFDGKFRRIEVRVKREDARVRARRGYLAIEPSRLLTPQPVKTPPQQGEADSRPRDPRPEATAAPLPAVEPLPPVTAGRVVEGAASATDPARLRLRPDATERVREIAAGGDKEADSLAARGWSAYERGDIESAVVALSEAAREPDVRPWVLYALGLSELALGRPGDAAASWERVRQAAPGFGPVYIDLADAYLQASEVTKALNTLREGSSRWPTDPEFHNAIGVLHVRRGALDEGIAAFTKALDAAPGEPLTYFNLGRAYQMRHARDTRYVPSQRRWVSPEGDRTKAIKYYQDYLKLGGPYVAQATEAIRLLEWARQ